MFLGVDTLVEVRFVACFGGRRAGAELATLSLAPASCRHRRYHKQSFV